MAYLCAVLVCCERSDTERSPPAPSPQTPELSAPVPSAPPKAEPPTKDPGRIPPDWVWVTDVRQGVEIALPALPRAAASPPDPAGRIQRALVSERGGSRYVATTTPSRDGALDEVRGNVARLGPARDLGSWGDDGISLQVGTGTQRVLVRARVDGDWIHTLEAWHPASDADAERFFASFSPRRVPRAAPVSSQKLGYHVQAPTRMGDWTEASAQPVIYGHRAVLDGHQLAVSVTDLGLVLGENATLDGSVENMKQSMQGQIITLDRTPHGGRPSRRFEMVAGNGMRAAVRLVLRNSDLIQTAVYAHSGNKAPWADAFVDSLVVE